MFSLRGALLAARRPPTRALSSAPGAASAAPAAPPAAAASSESRPPVPEEGCLAFFGLGAMGRPMAANLRLRHEPSFTGYGGLWTTSPMDVLVWNRTTAVAEEHAREHGTLVLDDDFALLPEAKISFVCLPTTDDVQGLLERAAPRMRRGSVVVDCTSGHPHQVRGGRKPSVCFVIVEEPQSRGTSGGGRHDELGDTMCAQQSPRTLTCLPPEHAVRFATRSVAPAVAELPLDLATTRRGS